MYKSDKKKSILQFPDEINNLTQGIELCLNTQILPADEQTNTSEACVMDNEYIIVHDNRGNGEAVNYTQLNPVVFDCDEVRIKKIIHVIL